jgi:hypothetical protein
MKRDCSLVTRLAWTGSLVVVLFGHHHVSAQPPNGNRWGNNSTAIAPPQGWSQGDPLTLTWGFANAGISITNDGFPVGTNNLPAFLNGIYGSQAVWQPHFQSVFNRWSSISGLVYQFEPNDNGAPINNVSNIGQLGVVADIRIAGKTLDGAAGPVLAYNYGPGSGEMVIDTSEASWYGNTGSNSLRLRNVVAHEHGHGIGQSHVDSNNANILLAPFASLSFDGPQHHDILVAQRHYGDARERSNALQGNDTPALASPLGTVTSSATTSIGNSARTLAVASTAIDFVSIDDNTDTDYFTFSIAGGRVDILLEALGFTYNATVQGGGGNQPFNTEQRSNLILTLFDTNGTTQLFLSNATGLGGDESITAVLPAGTYFIRVTGTDNGDTSLLDTQFYGLSISLAAVPEPATWALMIGGTLGAGVAYRRWRRRQQRLLDTEVQASES